MKLTLKSDGLSSISDNLLLHQAETRSARSSPFFFFSLKSLNFDLLLLLLLLLHHQAMEAMDGVGKAVGRGRGAKYRHLYQAAEAR